MSDSEQSAAGFYVVGGTMKPDAPSYIKRNADEELYRLIKAGEFCYILTSRQMGKSSLMARTADRLRADKAHVAIVDLSQIGTEREKASAARWYYGISRRICRELYIDTDIRSWWRSREDLPAVQRLTEFFDDVVLPKTRFPVVIFADEIDTTISLLYADDFFAAIRAYYSARATDYEFDRLNFILLGAASPSDLISDVRRTPFNIGHAIELTDFTFDEALPLASGLGPNPAQNERCLRRALYWTAGHPYMTQRLCAILAQQIPRAQVEEDVDRAVQKHFLDPAAIREDATLRFVFDRLTNYGRPRRDLLRLYRRIYRGKKVKAAPLSPLHSALKLSGAVVAGKDGALRVRNEVYRRVFTDEWARRTIPIDWNRRAAFGTLLMTIMLVLVGFLGLSVWFNRWQEDQAAGKILAGISPDEEFAAEESSKWRELEAYSEHVRFRATEIACSNPLVARLTEKKAGLFAHVVVGLDPDAKLSRQIARAIIIPGLRKSGAVSATYIACARIAVSLNLDAALATEVSFELLNRIKSAQSGRNSEVCVVLADALASLSARAGTKDAERLASGLMQMLNIEQNRESFAALGKAFASLNRELEPKDAQITAAALLQKMQTEQANRYDHNVNLVLTLGDALGNLGSKLEPSEIQAGASVLVEEMMIEDTGQLLLNLGEVLDRLSGRLKPEELKELASKLIDRMETTPSSEVLAALSETLAVLCSRMELKDIPPLISTLSMRTKTEPDGELLFTLWRSVSTLCSELKIKDTLPIVTELVERITKNENSQSLSALGGALGTFCSKFEAKDLKPAVLALLMRMKAEQDNYELSHLGNALGSFWSKLEPEDIKAAISLLIARMKTEKRSSVLSALSRPLGRFSSKLDPEDVRSAVALLSERMQTEENSYDLAELGNALGTFCDKLEPRDLKTAALVLLNRMKSEQRDYYLSALAKSWVILEKKASADVNTGERLREYVELLKLPFTVGDAQKELLRGLEHLTGERFEDDLWRFVDWAAKSGNRLDLNNR